MFHVMKLFFLQDAVKQGCDSRLVGCEQHRDAQCLANLSPVVLGIRPSYTHLSAWPQPASTHRTPSTSVLLPLTHRQHTMEPFQTVK